MIYLKFLDADRQPRDGGRETWPPPGTWAPFVPIYPNARGYHLARWSDLFFWIGPHLWTAEGNGDAWRDNEKIVFHQARLIRELAWNQTARARFLELIKPDKTTMAGLVRKAVEFPDNGPREFRASATAARIMDSGDKWILWKFATMFLGLCGMTEKEMEVLG
jgi:hypothetical protein